MAIVYHCAALLMGQFVSCSDQQAVILHAVATCTCPPTPPLILQYQDLYTAMQVAVCWFMHLPLLCQKNDLHANGQ